MNRHVLSIMLVMILAAFVAGVAQAGTKVKVCHIPPDDPANFHTITINAKAVPAHLAHGDAPGSCSEFADLLCDDGDLCTVDAFDPGTDTCTVPHTPVDCNDSNECTIDDCNAADGCSNTPVADGTACADASTGVVEGECDAGTCLPVEPTVECPCDVIGFFETYRPQEVTSCVFLDEQAFKSTSLTLCTESGGGCGAPWILAGAAFEIEEEDGLLSVCWISSNGVEGGPVMRVDALSLEEVEVCRGLIREVNQDEPLCN